MGPLAAGPLQPLVGPPACFPEVTGTPRGLAKLVYGVTPRTAHVEVTFESTKGFGALAEGFVRIRLPIVTIGHQTASPGVPLSAPPEREGVDATPDQAGVHSQRIAMATEHLKVTSVVPQHKRTERGQAERTLGVIK